MPNGNARYAQERPEDAGEREEALGDEIVARIDRRIFFGENDVAQERLSTSPEAKFCEDGPPKSRNRAPNDVIEGIQAQFEHVTCKQKEWVGRPKWVGGVVHTKKSDQSGPRYTRTS